MVKVFIENEANSNQKNIYNEKTLEYEGNVTVAGKYPYPYGFILNTTGGDGDNVDCFVITNRTLKSGEIVEVETMGMIEQTEDGEIDHKILGRLLSEAVTVDNQVVENVRTFANEIYADKPEKMMIVGELLGKAVADEYIQSCIDQWNK